MHPTADHAGRQSPHIIPCTCAPDLEHDFVPQTLCAREPGEPVLSAAIINCHTTGVNPRDRLTELGILRCTISRWRSAVLSLDAALTQLQDPGREIGADTLKYGGLSMELLQGARLDGACVERFLAGCDCIIAHSAAFHRHFFRAAGLQEGECHGSAPCTAAAPAGAALTACWRRSMLPWAATAAWPAATVWPGCWQQAPPWQAKCSRRCGRVRLPRPRGGMRSYAVI